MNTEQNRLAAILGGKKCAIRETSRFQPATDDELIIQATLAVLVYLEKQRQPESGVE
jgi:hypothetical protein